MVEKSTEVSVVVKLTWDAMHEAAAHGTTA